MCVVDHASLLRIFKTSGSDSKKIDAKTTANIIYLAPFNAHVVIFTHFLGNYEGSVFYNKT